ncbi:MAG TPA: OmpA family protein [Usitatibacter sp.]|nr:OmpA family protein [Usitatibacter sp.]
MKSNRLLPLTLIALAVLAGCSTLPATNSLLEQARNDFTRAQASPQVTTFAAGELKLASDSLDKANNAFSKDESRALVDHLSSVAKQQVAIAQETAAQKAAELAVANASAERDRARLDARTREADSARSNAEQAQREAAAAQRSAEYSQRLSEASQRSAEASQRQAATERQTANDAQMNAQAARQQSQDAENRSRLLEAQLREMEAKKTDRGTVITLGDVLFDTNGAQLKSGGVRSVQKLADFFKQYPQRKVMIEGFTDSTGTNSRNLELSDRRAGSVRTALLGMGVGTERITTRGYGESYPVAGNETAAGRQLNRRVEIIVSDDGGNIAAR